MKSPAARVRPLFYGIVMLLLLLGCNGDSPSAPSQPRPQPPAASAGVSGMVLDASGVCLPGAVVEVVDGARAGDSTTHNGICDAWSYGGEGYSLNVPSGSVRLRATKAGYRSKEETFQSPRARADIVLEKQ